MNKIPPQLFDEAINFVLLKEKEKIPFQQGWQNKKIKYNSPEFIEHIKKGGNYGVMGGGKKNLVIIDFDNKEVQEKVIEKLPKTFSVKTGSGLLHLYYFSDESKSFKIFDKEMNTLADIQGEGKQVVGAGSVHPNGNLYEVIDSSDINFLNYSEIKALLKPFDEKEGKKKEIKPYEKKSDDIIEEVKSQISMENVLEECGVDTSKNPTNCPFHSSKGGKCLGFDNETWHCFHCEESGNIFTMIQKVKNYSFKEALEYLAEKCGLSEKLKESRRKYMEDKNPIDNYRSKQTQYKFETFDKHTNFLSIVSEFHKIQPFHYDNCRIWWIWNFEKYCWEQIDETDLMIAIDKHTRIPNTSVGIKSSLLEAFKRVGRSNKPFEAKGTWIQFRDTIMDIETGTQFQATPSYFVTNPIPHKLGINEETPTIDKIFKEWIYREGIQDESYVETLKEIASYCLLPSMPLHRIFCFIGEGLNGKGTFLRFIENLVGENNKCATEIEILVSNRFESAKLYKKLVCITGEIDKGIFNKTKTLKSLSGDDLVRFEFKGKDGFDSHNYAKPLIATNHLPETTDKSKGFYRRWCIVDFPNTFNEKKDVIGEIPKQEYENFCLQSLKRLKKLLQRGEFTNEGSIEEREDKYEKHSGKLLPFIKEYCDISGGSIAFDEFVERFNEYVISNGGKKKSKIEIGRIVRTNNYELKNKKITTDFGNQTTKKHIFGIKWREDCII